jgi:tetratricopeptide (TPR) repeat protein
MSKPFLTLALLLTGCFSLATWVGPRFEQSNPRREAGFLAQTLGESRRLFASHLLTRSDVYFHSGYYPSIFDQAAMKRENHLARSAGAKESAHEEHGEHHEERGEAAHVHDGNCQHEEEHDFLGKPRDPLDAFTRNFFVSKHTHLTEKGTNMPKEILPWLQMSARLDPKLVESYTVGAFWLRDLGKKEEAEQFLREGLRHNPQSYEIMLELGRSYFDKRDYDRARNVLEMGLQRWREQENPKPLEQQNRFVAEQIVSYLARVEDRSGNRERTIRWLELLKKASPNPQQIDQRIAEVRAGKPLEAE